MKKVTFLINLIVLSLLFQLHTVTINKAGAVTNKVNDLTITRAVERALKKDEHVSAHLIDVQTSDGFVTLSGTVENILEKDRAAVVSMTVTGVRGVNNNITVAPVNKTDSEILGDVKDAILYDPATESYEIDVFVEDGVAILKGSVQSALEKLLAEYVAKTVRGVQEVTNRITVDYRLLRTDGEIEAEIKRGMKLNPYLITDNIEITVEKGKVFIKGVVPNLAQKARIRSRAYVNGVLEVDDSAVVVQPFTREDVYPADNAVRLSEQQMKEDIERRLARDPRLSSFDIDVTVEKSIVTLAGITDNLKAKKRAEEIAKNTGGIRKVKNHLKVRPDKIPDDTDVLLRINKALKRDPYLYRYEITAHVKNNKAYLDGTVQNSFEKQHVEDIVSKVRGVIAIDNRLVIDELWEWKMDEEIKENIDEELFWDSDLDSTNISVDVQDGIAILSGEVNSYQALEKAWSNALEGGARGVVNNLTVITIRPDLVD